LVADAHAEVHKRESEREAAGEVEAEQLVVKEQKEEGVVGWKTYRTYMRAGGGVPRCMAVVLL
jgi:hypothetical protein